MKNLNDNHNFPPNLDYNIFSFPTMGYSGGTVTSLYPRFCDFDQNKRFYFKLFKKIALLCTNYSVNCANKSIKNSISKPFILPLMIILKYNIIINLLYELMVDIIKVS